MKNQKCFSRTLGLLLSWLVAAVLASSAQSSLQTIDMPQGGTITYGSVADANTQKGAILGVLRIMHKNCGEKPKIGQVFKLRGTDSVGLYFTVTNHSGGNIPVAGLILAAATGPNKVEAALMSDKAERFASTIGPMMNKLFSVWHPSGMPAPSATSDAGGTPPQRSTAPSRTAPSSGQSGPAAKLHTVTAADNSVSLGIPDGWKLDPNSGHGAIVVRGPQGQFIMLGVMKSAVDPSHPWQRNFARNGGRPLPGQMVYPYQGSNLAKVYPDMVQAWRRAAGGGPAKIKVDQTVQMPQRQGSTQECVSVQGHIDPDGKGMQAMSEMMCAIKPLDWGGYSVTRYQSLAPSDAIFERDTATRAAMFATLKVNQAVMNQQNAEMMKQKQADDARIAAGTQQEIARRKQAFENQQTLIKSKQDAYDAQHAQWWAEQDSKARTNQGFTNYQRDQTVIRDTYYPNEHVTVWNQTADWLKKTFPNRIEDVPPSQYIKGTDYY